MPDILAGLDIGTTKTCAVIVEAASEPARGPVLRVLGVGQARTGGLRREVVADIEETTASVRKAMEEAELMAGVRTDRVFAGLAGDHIDAGTSTGVVAVSHGEIQREDVDRVHQVARAVVVPADRELLHVLPQEYIVDHQRGIRDPVGMACTRLEAEVYIITSAIAATQNLRKAISRAGYEVEAFVHESLAAALAVLTEDEKDVGVAMIDLGGGTTEVAVIRDGKTRHLATIPAGGAMVTSDLVKGLSVPFAEAERAKEQFGAARAELVDPRETVELPAPGPGAPKQVARELIAHIIEQRMDEIMALAAREIEESGESGRLGAGIVLTGGGASLVGALDVAQNVFGMPVRIGVPGQGLAGLADAVQRPKFATAAGLAIYGAYVRGQAGAVARQPGVAGRFVGWLREFF